MHLVNGKLHHAALAFGVSIGLTFNADTATLAGYDFVFGNPL
ncbi:MAG TPA: hypothetical protein VIQ77_05785 [Mucilaginibacter sp.]